MNQLPLFEDVSNSVACRKELAAAAKKAIDDMAQEIRVAIKNKRLELQHVPSIPVIEDVTPLRCKVYIYFYLQKHLKDSGYRFEFHGEKIIIKLISEELCKQEEAMLETLKGLGWKHK